MADERENIIEEREKKLNDERQKIETFSDFAGRNGFVRNLTSSEIVQQIILLSD